MQWRTLNQYQKMAVSFFIRLEQLKQVKKGLLRKGTNPKVSQYAEKKI
jgi:hypothetical protein